MSRGARLAVGAGLLAAGLCFTGCSTAEPQSVTGEGSDGIVTSAPTPDPTTTTVAAPDSVSTELALTTPIPGGAAVVVPDGPFVDGQQVTVMAAGSERIDLYNSSPRLCARVRGGDEICDPTWARPQPVTSSPAGTQGVLIELTRTHFGPEGESDCAAPDVECRLLWRTESGHLLSSDILSFTGAMVEPATVSLQASIGEEPGVVTVEALGLDNDPSVEDAFSSPQMEMMADDVASAARFDPSRVQLTWYVAGLCGFGPGDPPLGSEELAEPPSWWAPAGLDPGGVDPSVVRSFFGASCDYLHPDRPIELRDGDSLDLVVSRDIYGYGGWIDCAVAACWIELVASWSHPMPDGSTLGSGRAVDRVLVDVPKAWPTRRPTIAVKEQGPYSPGQQVTVEVRDHPMTSDGLGIGWCPGDDSYCTYRFSTYVDGVHRVTWQIPLGSADCGTNRCFFEIDSGSEGLAPPAIVVVPINID